jgi:hypothetical protein
LLSDPALGRITVDRMNQDSNTEIVKDTSSAICPAQDLSSQAHPGMKIGKEENNSTLPDLDVWPSTFGVDHQLKYRLRRVLEEREQNRYPTVVYCETPDEFGWLFEGRYKKVSLHNIIPPGHNTTWRK